MASIRGGIVLEPMKMMKGTSSEAVIPVGSKWVELPDLRKKKSVRGLGLAGHPNFKRRTR